MRPVHARLMTGGRHGIGDLASYNVTGIIYGETAAIDHRWIFMVDFLKIKSCHIGCDMKVGFIRRYIIYKGEKWGGYLFS